MATLTVWKFADPDGADQALATLEGLQKQGLVEVLDGASDDFIKSVRDEVTPGTSALFLMSQNAVADRVRSAFAGTNAQLIRTNLSDEQEARLREAFGEED